jgi:RimJ/RimL family protein N-acetyltransferase
VSRAAAAGLAYRNGVVICETRRLVLRRFTLADLEPLAAILADPDVTRFFGGPRALDQTRARMLDFLDAYEKVGFSKWAVVLRETGELMGRCGPAVVDVEGGSEVELGYDLAKRFWGQGFATEAAAASLDHCFSVLGLTRVVSIIHPENVASRRVAEHLGMNEERAVVWREQSLLLYAKASPRS